MNLEKINGNIKWYREKQIKNKIKGYGEESEIWVMLDGYNICF